MTAQELTAAARAAGRSLNNATTKQKNDALRAMAKALRKGRAGVLEQNRLDVEQARAEEKDAAFIDRLVLDAPRIEAMARAVEAVAKLEDPVGEITERWKRPNGLKIRKQRLPLG